MNFRRPSDSGTVAIVGAGPDLESQTASELPDNRPHPAKLRARKVLASVRAPLGEQALLPFERLVLIRFAAGGRGSRGMLCLGQRGGGLPDLAFVASGEPARTDGEGRPPKITDPAKNRTLETGVEACLYAACAVSSAVLIFFYFSFTFFFCLVLSLECLPDGFSKNSRRGGIRKRFVA